MPRIYTSQNDPLDFCRSHFPTEAKAQQRYANKGDGPDGRGNCFAYDAEHPDYADGEEYYCETCKHKLDERDNF